MYQKKLLNGVVLVLVLLGIYFVLQRSLRSDVPHSATLGATAPDFSLPQLNGHPLELSDYRGKVVLLDFWATWCDPCRDEIPRFEALQSKHGQEGLQIIGVSMDDTPDPVREFYEQFKMNYPVVLGNAQIGELYGGVLGLPIAFVIARDGHIHSKHVGTTNISVFEREIMTLLRK